MRVILLQEKKLCPGECPVPVPGAGEVLIRVAYAGVNRADLFQKQGRYPKPEGNPPIPGMEVSGEIIACGKDVHDLKKGDRVCALLSEGGYGEYVCAPATLVFGVPEGVSLEQAAALPEACFTAWISFVLQARLSQGETALVHGGASGIGIIAIQIARLLGARVFATAGTQEKCAVSEKHGAEKAINYRTEDYTQVIKNATEGKGVDVILDMVGGDYFERNLACLAEGGRLCIIAFLKGSSVTANLSPILLKHLTVMGSTLRSRPLAEKERIALALRKHVWPAVAAGGVKPVIDQLFPLEEAEKALLRMDQGLNIGKILLKI